MNDQIQSPPFHSTFGDGVLNSGKIRIKKIMIIVDMYVQKADYYDSLLKTRQHNNVFMKKEKRDTLKLSIFLKN